jgi:hypothetical protein
LKTNINKGVNNMNFNFTLQVTYRGYASYTVAPQLKELSNQQQGIQVSSCWFNLCLLPPLDSPEFMDKLAYLLWDKLAEKPTLPWEVNVIPVLN